ncbi:MAG: histidine--tRNA ligase [Candidatus Omnitrophica bacterium]|nr:histidine--tRNA ligase [Candidatus Omnitrophota bacterium]
MPDLLPETLEKMNWLEDRSRKIFRVFGYEEIRTPMLEETEVFTRSIGEDTDIVEKEMYTLLDRGGKSISLRPEGTASIIRAYIEHGWANLQDVVKLFYVGPMFRGERPQKGRLRQFHQIGAEMIGGKDPVVDAELISNLNELLSELGVKGFTILINSLGCQKDRKVYKEKLASYLKEKISSFCPDCVRRADKNILRVLDCKNENCKKAVKDAPIMLDSLCDDCSARYTALKNILKDLKIPFSEKKDLVRGLDYYTGIVFEVTHPSLGAQDAIAAGGRYDDLCKEMSGPEAGATGYAVGVERLLLCLDEKDIPKKNKGILIVPVGDDLKLDAFYLAGQFRKERIPCETDLTGRSFKGQMRKANKENRKYIVILGEEEKKNGKMLLKNMTDGAQETLSFDEVVKKVREELS